MNKSHTSLPLLLIVAALLICPSVALTWSAGESLGGPIDGGGTAGRIAKFTDSQTIGDSVITEFNMATGNALALKEPCVLQGDTGNSFIDFRGSQGLRVRTGSGVLNMPIMSWSNGGIVEPGVPQGGSGPNTEQR